MCLKILIKRTNFVYHSLDISVFDETPGLVVGLNDEGYITLKDFYKINFIG